MLKCSTFVWAHLWVKVHPLKKTNNTSFLRCKRLINGRKVASSVSMTTNGDLRQSHHKLIIWLSEMWMQEEKWKHFLQWTVCVVCSTPPDLSRDREVRSATHNALCSGVICYSGLWLLHYLDQATAEFYYSRTERAERGVGWGCAGWKATALSSTNERQRQNTSGQKQLLLSCSCEQPLIVAAEKCWQFG